MLFRSLYIITKISLINHQGHFGNFNEVGCLPQSDGATKYDCERFGRNLNTPRTPTLGAFLRQQEHGATVRGERRKRRMCGKKREGLRAIYSLSELLGLVRKAVGSHWLALAALHERKPRGGGASLCSTIVATRRR